ncbi:hypothetical protein GPL15_22080 [Clostridium sp. MCC353]|uniref:hypothetical protein n=1 Tax=Clostridium sp. MCC353 TaxID=2592646 RepID=UPI001C02F83D|nr:hypothetical protein [Clostridium sp. MCC353]MBT9779171.1 hypothetical protein [Clostridium sp. MCC353]
MNLIFQLTKKGQRKSCAFAAYCTASLLAQILLSVFIAIYIVWNAIADVPPATMRNLMILLIIYSFVLVLLWIFYYRRILQKDNRLANGVITFHCSLTPRYVWFYNDEQPELNCSANYGDFRKVLTVGKNIFFSADIGRNMLFFMIPAGAFQSSQQFKEAKKYIKNAVKEQQRAELKTPVLGHFFRGLFGAWFRHILFGLKMFMVLLAVWFVFLLVMAAAVELKK